MKIKKIIALILCAAMLMYVLAGCNTSVDDVVNEYTGENNTDDTDDTTVNRDFDAGRAVYDADEIVLTVDGEDITWDEYFNWLCYSLYSYEYNYGEVTDFSAETTYGTTAAEEIIADAHSMIALYKGVEKNIEELNISYADDIDEQIKEDWESGIEVYGTEEELLEAVKQSFGSRELYEYLFRVDSVSDDIFAALYGANGEKLTDAQLKEGSEGYYMAKHILVMTVDEENNALDDEALAKAKSTIEEVYNLLTAYDGDDLEGYFDELTAQYTEDTGYETYPDGYLFTESDMVTEFYDATAGLEIGKFSEIVESSYGYHIILRLPVDFEAVPMYYAAYGYDYSLRYIIAYNLFSLETASWTDSVNVETTDFYNSIDLNKVFSSKG